MAFLHDTPDTWQAWRTWPWVIIALIYQNWIQKILPWRGTCHCVVVHNSSRLILPFFSYKLHPSTRWLVWFRKDAQKCNRRRQSTWRLFLIGGRGSRARILNDIKQTSLLNTIGHPDIAVASMLIILKMNWRRKCIFKRNLGGFRKHIQSQRVLACSGSLQ